MLNCLSRVFTVPLLVLAQCSFATPLLAQTAPGLPVPTRQAPVMEPAQPSVPTTMSGATTASAPVTPDENYRLGAGDKIRITVYAEDDLGGEFLVDGSGEVQLPLIGRVPAANKTVHEFVEHLTNVLGSKYLRDPKVNIQIINFRPFYILGEVNKPGEYPSESSLDVLNAVALAGGYTFRANESYVKIRRSGAPKEIDYPATSETKVFPGDIVRVRERIF